MDGAGLGIPVIVASRPLDAVLVIQPDVEPDGRIERAVLMQAHPGQVAIEVLAVLARLEVAVGDAPIGNRPGDAENHLPHARFALRSAGLAVEILADDDVRRQGAPGLGDFAVGLLEEDAAAFVLDLGGPLVPLDGVKRVDAGRTELRRDFHGARPIRLAVVSVKASHSKPGPSDPEQLPFRRASCTLLLKG